MFKKFIMGAALAIVSSAALALPTEITGQISFGGAVDLVDSTNTATDLAGATGLQFGAVNVLADTTRTTGTFDGLEGMVATFNDFQFSPVLSPAPVTMWSVVNGTLTYELILSGVDSVQKQTFGTPSTGIVDYLLLGGSGTLKITDSTDNTFISRDGAWSLSADSVNGGTFAFSSTAVPAPASLAMLGVGLVMAAAARRRARA